MEGVHAEVDEQAVAAGEPAALAVGEGRRGVGHGVEHGGPILGTVTDPVRR
jgi:hypothetical protein